jgi:hypothetical protein
MVAHVADVFVEGGNQFQASGDEGTADQRRQVGMPLGTRDKNQVVEEGDRDVPKRLPVDHSTGSGTTSASRLCALSLAATRSRAA